LIGLDTNVLVRYLTQDDPAQARQATQAMESAAKAGEILFVSTIVVCELVWVLEDVYGYNPTDIADVLDKILRTGSFVFEDKDLLWQAFEDYQRGKGDLSDYLVGRIGKAVGCAHTLTFDRDLKNNRMFKLL
jgi:predicted nucleic-acid-binding protein